MVPTGQEGCLQALPSGGGARLSPFACSLLTLSTKLPMRFQVLGSDIEARLWGTARIFTAPGFSALERAEQIDEWRMLTAEKKGRNLRPLGDRNRNEAGIKATAKKNSAYLSEKYNDVKDRQDTNLR